jgi:hypothetical protein
MNHRRFITSLGEGTEDLVLKKRMAVDIQEPVSGDEGILADDRFEASVDYISTGLLESSQASTEDCAFNNLREKVALSARKLLTSKDGMHVLVGEYISLAA